MWRKQQDQVLEDATYGAHNQINCNSLLSVQGGMSCKACTSVQLELVLLVQPPTAHPVV